MITVIVCLSVYVILKTVEYDIDKKSPRSLPFHLLFVRKTLSDQNLHTACGVREVIGKYL